MAKIRFNNTQLTRSVGTAPASVLLGSLPFSTSTYDRLLTDPTPTALNFFGNDVSVSGTKAIVGVPKRTVSGFASAGVAYIHDTTTGNVLHTLQHPSPSANDSFGKAVAISGNYAVVGAPYDDDVAGDSGSVHIFNVTTGQLLYNIKEPIPAPNNRFGEYLAVKGNYAVISAFNSGADGSGSGKAYIYDVTTGNLVHTLSNPSAFSTPLYDKFGISVAISDTHVVVGAESEGGVNVNSGAAYLFDIATGNLLHSIINPNDYSTPNNDYFGRSVAVGSSHFAVGAPLEDVNGQTNPGIVYVYDNTTGNLIYTITNPAPNLEDNFGEELYIDANYLVVGNRREDNPIVNAGSVYIYDLNTGNLIITIDNPNSYSTFSNDSFGISVSLSGSTLVVGATGEDGIQGSGIGAVYVLTLS